MQKDGAEQGKAGNTYRTMCNKCEDPRHLTRDYKPPDCIMYGKNSHTTGDCAYLKQMKLVPKFVGVCCQGLGVFLIQNLKEVVSSEHTNPMAIVNIASSDINETKFLEGFNYMFS